MRFSNEVEQLTREIEQEESKYVTSTLLETEIMETIAEGEFAPVIRRTRPLAKQRALAERIRRNKIMLAWAQK